MSALCIIGTSHIAALKHGIELLVPAPAHTIDFFGAAGSAFGETQVVDGCIVPVTGRMRKQFQLVSQGRDRIELDRYDAFAVAGFAGLQEVLALHAGWRTFGMGQAEGCTLVSEHCFVDAIIEQYLAQPGIRLALQIRAARNVPVFVLPRPHLAEGGAGRKQVWRIARESGNREVLLACFERAQRALGERGLTVLPQPPVSLADPLYTLQEYGAGSKGLIKDEEHGDADYVHMNARYGVLVLQQLSGALDGAPAH